MMPPDQPTTAPVSTGICHCANAAILVLSALYFFLIPGAVTVHDLSDPNIRAAGIPRSAWKLHRSLSPQFERWAKERLDSKRAAELPTSDISGTEWPLFGTVFYLWATESLQDEWEKGHPPGAVAPKVYARGAIQAATRLVMDPTQANWVKIHWGKNYLKTENVFYRMLVIAALTSHARLTGDKEYLPLLKDRVDSLSAELDASRHGLLDDYPHQCFPGDVLTSIAMIHRADKILNTDHSAFVSRAIRGFQNQALDSRGLVPYFADASLGEPLGTSHGCGNSYVSLFAPEICRNKHESGMTYTRGISGRKPGRVPASGSFQRICPPTTGTLTWIPDWCSKVSVAPPVHLGLARLVLTDILNTPIRSRPRCWSPRGRFRMAHVSFPGCFPMRPMHPTSVRPPFYLTSPVCRRKEFPSRPAVPCRDSS